MFKGKDYAFSIGGLGVGGIGVQTIDAEALEDFAGRNMFAVLRFRVPFLRRCSESGFQYCVPRRGRTSRVRVCIDEFPMAAGVDMLGSYPPEYFHLIELYDRGTMIRAYSKRFVARLAKHPRRLDPLGVRC